MANVYLQDSTLTSIGSAIREKNGQSTLYLPSQMPDAIRSLKIETNEYDIYRILSSPANSWVDADCWTDWKTYIPTAADFDRIVSCTFLLGSRISAEYAAVVLTPDLVRTEDNWYYRYNEVPTQVYSSSSGGSVSTVMQVLFYKNGDGVLITDPNHGYVSTDKYKPTPIILVMKK